MSMNLLDRAVSSLLSGSRLHEEAKGASDFISDVRNANTVAAVEALVKRYGGKVVDKIKKRATTGDEMVNFVVEVGGHRVLISDGGSGIQKRQRKHGMVDRFVATKSGTVKEALDRFAADLLSEAAEPVVKGDAETAAAKAAKTPEEISAAFDKLKSGQVVWLSYTAVMSMRGKDYKPYVVGRKSFSKKYVQTSFTINSIGGPPKSPFHRGPGSRTKLYRYDAKPGYRESAGRVGVAMGDMAATLHGIWIP